MLMNEFDELGKAQNPTDLKQRIQDIERITSKWSDLAQISFSEEHEISKIKMFVPNNICNYIAVNLHGISRYDGIVQLIEAQTKDPFTGVMRSKTAPALNPMHPGHKAKGEEDKAVGSDWGGQVPT